MTNKTGLRLLNIGAAIGLTVGGASAIPGCDLPSQLLFYGLLLAAICKAVAGELVQVKGQSDEAQGITPTQIAAVQAVHDQAKVGMVVALSPPTSVITTTAKTLTILCVIVGSLWLCTACSSIATGNDPLIVHTEQTETTAYNTFDAFLKVDDICNSNPLITNIWVAPHAFAQYLRKPIINGTNTVPFGIATVLSLDQVKLSYKAGITTSNALLTAVSTLETAISQATQYMSLVSTNK